MRYTLMVSVLAASLSGAGLAAQAPTSPTTHADSTRAAIL